MTVPYFFISSLLFTLIDPLTRDTIHVNNRSYIAWKIHEDIYQYISINTQETL